MRKIFTLFLLSLFFAVSGCIEIRDEFFLNPNSSGKVVHKAVFQPIDFNLNEQAQSDPEKEMLRAVRDELTKSEGVETWKDVSYERTDDDRILFKGTAYFKNLADLKLHNSGTHFSILIPQLQKEGPGTLMLKLEDKSSEKKADQTDTKKPLSEAEIEKQIKAQRSAYNRAKPMMLGMLSTFVIEQKYHLPGKLIRHANLKPDANGILHINLTGEKILSTIDELMKDDAWVRKQV